MQLSVAMDQKTIPLPALRKELVVGGEDTACPIEVTEDVRKLIDEAAQTILRR